MLPYFYYYLLLLDPVIIITMTSQDMQLVLGRDPLQIHKVVAYHWIFMMLLIFH
jgi:hypothetical protein